MYNIMYRGRMKEVSYICNVILKVYFHIHCMYLQSTHTYMVYRL